MHSWLGAVLGLGGLGVVTALKAKQIEPMEFRMNSHYDLPAPDDHLVVLGRPKWFHQTTESSQDRSSIFTRDHEGDDNVGMDDLRIPNAAIPLTPSTPENNQPVMTPFKYGSQQWTSDGRFHTYQAAHIRPFPISGARRPNLKAAIRPLFAPTNENEAILNKEKYNTI